MAKINGEGVPTYTDARGTEETAVNAVDQEFFLDPTASADDEGNLVDNKGLVIEGDDAEQYETREERQQREERERTEQAREKTRETLDDAKAHEHESGDAGKFTSPTPADVAKQAAHEKDSDSASTVNAEKAGTNASEVKSSAGTSSKASLKQPAKTSATN